MRYAMKKKFLLGLFISIFALFGLTACGESKVSANFDKEEYIISIEDSIDILQFLNVENVEQNDLTIESTNPNIAYVYGGHYLQTQVYSGQTYVVVKYKNTIIASTKLFVKYKLPSPSNLQINQETGVLVWDKNYVAVEEENIFADGYEVNYKNVSDGNYNKAFETARVQTNSFIFSEPGSYVVSIKALSNSKYVDNSPSSDEKIIYYNSMEQVDEITLSYENGYENEATISWTEVENAKFDVYVNDIRIKQNLVENHFNYDFSNLQREINIEIVSKDSLEQKASTKAVFTIYKLDKPEVSYIYSAENEDGYLTWGDEDCFNGTTVLAGEQKKTGGSEFEILEGFDSGIFDISVLANGGEYFGDYYASSDKTVLTVAKLPKPQVDAEFTLSNVTLTFTFDEYIKNYKIQYGEEVAIKTISEDDLIWTTNLSDLNAGAHKIFVTALPTIGDDDKVLAYEIGDKSSNYVLNSDPVEFDFFVLDEFSNVIHSFETKDEKNLSVLSFDTIANANKFTLIINGEEIELDEEAIIFEEDLTKIYLPDLTQIEPVDEKYTIEITAGRNENDSTEAQTTKVLTILSPVGYEAFENGDFAWSDNQSLIEYQYKIYQSNFDFSEKGEVAYSGTTNEKEISDLAFGYYKAEVISLSTDVNEFLNSNFYDETNIYSRDFIVTEQIEMPDVVFVGNDAEGFKLSISQVDFAGTYQIYLDGNDVGTVARNDEDENVYYIFQADALTTAKTYQVTVVAIAGDDFDETIHLNSNEKILSVTRLSKPTYSVRDSLNSKNIKDGEILNVVKDANAKEADILYSNGNIVSSSGNINLKSLGNEFVLNLINIAKDDEVNSYFIDSEVTRVTFKRLPKPTNFEYENGNINFKVTKQDYSKADKFYFTIKAGSYQVGYFLTNDKSLTSEDEYINVSVNYNNLINLINDASLNNAILGANSIDITIALSKIGEIENVFYLPSTSTDATTIEKLIAPELSFVKDTQTISWSAQEGISGIKYSIFVNEVEKINDHTASSVTLSALDLTDEQLLDGVSIKIVAKHINHISSSDSNIIKVKKLAQINTVRIKNGEVYISSTQNNAIDELRVNGSGKSYSNETISFTPISGISSYTLQFISYQTERTDGYFYLDSVETSFTLKELSQLAFTAEICDDNLTFTDLYTGNFIKASKNPIVYTIALQSDGSKKFTTTENLTPLQEIERKLGVDFASGNTTLKITANVLENYSFNIANGDAVGYYDEVSTTPEVTKLQEISSAIISICDGGEINYEINAEKYSEKSNAYATLTWTNNWLDNVLFNVKIGNHDTILMSDGISGVNYSLTLSENNYVLTLKKELLNSAENKIEIITQKIGNINSAKFSTTISRCSNISAEISDDGVLTVTNSVNQSNKFIAKITSNEEVEYITGTVNDSNGISLIEAGRLLHGKYGSFAIEVLAYDHNNVAEKLPIYSSVELIGAKLHGIESVAIQDTGVVEIKLYEDDPVSSPVFKATLQNETKTIALTKNENIYQTTLTDLISLFGLTNSGEYTITFEVYGENVIKGDDKEISFNYNTSESDETCYLYRNGDYDTYLKLTHVEDTKYIRLILKCDTTTLSEKYFKVTNADSLVADLNESVDTLFSGMASGNYEILCSRSSVSDGVITQYNQQQILITKLSTIDDSHFKIENNFAKWNAVNNASAYIVTLNGESKATSFGEKYDLRNAGMVVNTDYDVQVVSVSSTTNTIKSEPSQAIQTMRYSSVPKIVVKDGKFMFDENGLVDYDDKNNLFTLIGNTASDKLPDLFSDEKFEQRAPFYFSINDLENAAVKLVFTDVESGKIYSVYTRLFNFIPDFEVNGRSYLAKLEELPDDPSSALYSFLSVMKKSNKYCGDEGLLLDEVAGIVPAGTYKISVIRCNNFIGTTSTLMYSNYIDSEASEQTFITIQAPPAVELSISGSDYYSTISSLDTNKVYKILVRETDENDTTPLDMRYLTCKKIEFLLRYNSENTKWELYKDEDVINNGSIYEQSQTSVTLDLKKLREAGGIEYNKYYRVDVFVYYGNETTYSETITNNTGESYTTYYLNGKSGYFTIEYLDIKIEGSLDVTDGELSVKEPDDSKVRFETLLVEYKLSNSESKDFEVNFEFKVANVDLEYSGYYEYVNLSLKGGIDGKKIKVGSDTYGLSNVYKLKAPSFQIDKGELSITHENSTGEIYFGYSETDDNWKKLFGEVKLMNKDQSTYMAYVRGNSVSSEFSVGDPGTNCDHKVNYTGSIYLSSDITNFSAEMLDSVENIHVDKGNISWDELPASLSHYDDRDQETTNKVYIIYKVIVEYCTGSDINTRQLTRTFYTTSTTINSELFLLGDGSDSNYNYYRISVIAIAGIADSSNLAIKTLEEDSYLLSNITTAKIKFNNDCYVLRSEEATLKIDDSEFVSKTASPSIIGNGVYGGILHFELADSNDEYIVMANGKIIEGRCDRDGNRITFIPKDNEIDLTSAFNIEIYAYQSNKIYSVPLVVDSVYKLPAASEEYFDYEINNSSEYGMVTELDFAKYFENIKYSGSNDCYNIKITETSNYTTYTLTKNQSTLSLNGLSSITIQVCDSQADNQSNPQKLLNSDTKQFTIKDTDVSGLTIEWQENDNKFTWNFDVEGNYSYYYILKFKDGLNVITEEGKTNNNYYMPKTMGKEISSFVVYARKVSEESNELYVYASKNWDSEGVKYSTNLFQNGNGDQLNPYVIKNEVEFKNIAKRSQGEFFFKLDDNFNNNFEIKLSEFNIDNFYGQLDGNGKNIKIIADQTFDLNPTYFDYMPDNNVRHEFSSYSALFGFLMNGSKIYDLKLDYSISYTLNHENIFFAGLCYKNDGEISDITITNYSVSFSKGENGGNFVLLSGIASRNNGNILNCVDEASLNIQNPEDLTIDIGYSSIVSVNISGATIKNCFNKVNKKIEANQKNSTIYLAGISLINRGSIILCGNDGNFNVSDNNKIESSSCYIAGITLSSTGKLIYVYNNGTITKTSSIVSLTAYGIAYKISGGEINTLVDTQTTHKIVYSASSYTNANNGKNYTNVTGSVLLNIANLQIVNISFDGYTFSVTEENGQYTAQIVKN